MVKTYSLKKDGDKRLSENFLVKEFRSRDGADKILIDEKLVSLLQKMRDKFGAVSISSAYRTVAYNRKVGGVSNSQHLYGLAADVTIKDNSRLPEAAQYAEKIGFRGVGLDDKHQDFLHLDTRKNKSFFRYRANGSTYSVPSFFTTVKLGSKGEEVKLLQKKLTELGYKDESGNKLVSDGVFGKNTEYALKNFQKKMSLVTDGIAGPKTWCKL